MPAPAADCVVDPSTAAPSRASADGDIPNINPATGLSTDYLNHFTEAIMMLDMLASTPECVDDLRAWRPKTYVEHFTGSRFKDRDAVIRAYEAADPAVRDALDRVSATLNIVLTQARDMMVAHRSAPSADALARRTVTRLRPLMARAAAVINGLDVRAAERHGPQAAVDAILAR
jgi:hypothetical protein